MKKVKIMLMSIALVAIVGGALAFKASTKYTLDLCSTVPLDGTCGIVNGARTTCPVFNDNVRFTNAEIDFVCTTTANAGGSLANKCKIPGTSDDKTCTTVATTKIEAEPVE